MSFHDALLTPTPTQVALSFVVSALVGAFVAFDARRRGANPFVWGAIGFLFGALGLVAWLVARSVRARRAPAPAGLGSCAECGRPLAADAPFCVGCGAERAR